MSRNTFAQFSSIVRRFGFGIALAVIILGGSAARNVSAAPLADNQWFYLSSCKTPAYASVDPTVCTMGDQSGYGVSVSVMPAKLVAAHDGWVTVNRAGFLTQDQIEHSYN